MARPRKERHEPNMDTITALVIDGFNMTHEGRPEGDYMGAEYIMQYGYSKKIFEALAQELDLVIR